MNKDGSMEVKILLKFISFGVDNVNGGKVDIDGNEYYHTHWVAVSYSTAARFAARMCYMR